MDASSTVVRQLLCFETDTLRIAHNYISVVRFQICIYIYILKSYNRYIYIYILLYNIFLHGYGYVFIEEIAWYVYNISLGRPKFKRLMHIIIYTTEVLRFYAYLLHDSFIYMYIYICYSTSVCSHSCV